MNRIALFILTGITTFFFAACTAPDGTSAVNNANTERPALAAPTAAELLAIDKRAQETYFKGDAKFFDEMLSDKFVMLGPGGTRTGKAATIAMIAGVKCDITEGSKFEEPHLSAIDADTYVLSYKGVFDGTCIVDGKSGKIPSPVRGATVWIRSGDKWLATFHGENLIVDPKAAAAPHAVTEVQKDVPKKVSAPDAAPVASGDPVADAVTAIENNVWEAWKSRDAAKLEELTAGDVAFVDIFGNVTSGKANTIKFWTEHECDIKSVRVTDGVATSLSPAAAILTFKGTAEGTCSGQKLDGPIYGTSVYVKNGGTWKLAFTFNSPD